MSGTDIAQRVADFRFTVPQALWLAAGSVAATLIIGFGIAGWQTGGAAKKHAEEAALAARTELGVAACVEEFMAARDATKRLSSLKEAAWHQREKLVSDAGFATLPGSKEADSAIAAQCANQLADLTPQQKGS